MPAASLPSRPKRARLDLSKFEAYARRVILSASSLTLTLLLQYAIRIPHDQPRRLRKDSHRCPYPTT